MSLAWNKANANQSESWSCSYKTAVIEIILIIYLDFKDVQQNNPMKEGLVVCSKYNKNDYNNNNI